MRNLDLVEFGTALRVQLSNRQVRALNGTPLGLLVRATGHSRNYDVTAGSIVGVVSCHELVVRVRPKISDADVLQMLVRTGAVGELEYLDIPTGESGSIVEITIAAYVSALERALREGPPPLRYQLFEETSPSVRGRVRWDLLQLRQFGQFPPVPVRFEDLTKDNPLNRRLLGALGIASALGSSGLVKTLPHFVAQFDGVIPHRTEIQRPLEIDVREEHYRAPLRLAELLLNGGSLGLTEGQHMGFGFLVDMNLLFERYVAAILVEELAPLGYSLDTEAIRYLDVEKRVRLQPDFLVKDKSGKPVAVADAKYKSTSGVKNADAYQALAYALSFGVSDVWLLYADGDDFSTMMPNGVRLTLCDTALGEGEVSVRERLRTLVRTSLSVLSRAAAHGTSRMVGVH